jgi:hypothetical protein
LAWLLPSVSVLLLSVAAATMFLVDFKVPFR